VIEIQNEFIVCFDVDETLVLWPENHGFASHTQPSEGSIAIRDPYDGSTNHLVPYKKHIDLLKKYKGRGMCVVVWSAGGVLWAKSVVNTLGLADYVDLVMTKPSKLVDDLSLSKIFPKPIYIK